MRRPIRNAAWGACVALALVFVLGGCAPKNIDSTYGKRRGARGGSSVNGTHVLAKMFERAGHRVTSWRRLSPKITANDVIVWAPNDFHPPSLDQRVFLEEWLSGESQRTLVYIGRDFDAARSYWQNVQSQAPPEQLVEVSRRLANVQARNDAARDLVPKELPSDWFTWDGDHTTRKIESVEGPWSEGIDASQLDMEITSRLKIPSQEEIEESLDRDEAPRKSPLEFESLLLSEGEPLVTRVTHPLWSDSQILVVSNGSFLLNLPLVNHEHRKLAGRLISACGEPGRTVFLESGPGELTVYDEEPDANAPTGFEIFTIWPIGVIVLHMTVMGIAACFALLPIFGRARRIDEESTSDFGKHVEAYGELLEATHDRKYAITRIQHYHEHVKRDLQSTGQADE
jgi:hypothetical protein